jgi:uncharacterized membrane protein YqjE
MFILTSCFLALVVITKFMDLYSTVKHGYPEREKNPLVKILMNTGMGLRWTLYTVTAFAIIIVIGVWVEMYYVRSVWYEIATIIISGIVAYAQFGAYMHNSKRKELPGMKLFTKSRYYS